MMPTILTQQPILKERLSDDEVIRRLERKNLDWNNRGYYESLLTVITQCIFADEIKGLRGWEEIEAMIAKRLHPDKQDRTMAFFTFPMECVGEAQSALQDLWKVFEARNASFSNNYMGADPQRGDELFDRLSIGSYVKETARTVLTNKPNTYTVVDYDSVGLPYIVTVEEDRLIDVEFVPNSHVEVAYIAFLHSVGTDDTGQWQRYAFYDDQSYRVFEKRKGGQPVLLFENNHNLGYCPARPFLSHVRYEMSKDRYNPLAASLGLLLDYQLAVVFEKYGENYIPFPVTIRPKGVSECDQEGCVDGYIERTSTSNGELITTRVKCEKCAKPDIFGGPGTTVDVDPLVIQGVSEDSRIFRFESPEITGLEMYARSIEKRRMQFRKSVTGINEMLATQAVNIEQVQAVMESAKKPLLVIAQQLNDIDKWLHETLYRAAFGSDMIRYANWGTDWFILTAQQVFELYERAKNMGMKTGELDSLYDLHLATRHKTSPHMLRKKRLELQLDPAPHKTDEEAYAMRDRGTLSQLDLIIKTNFARFIARYEREYEPLTQVGHYQIEIGELTYRDLVDQIYQQLIEYANENIESEQMGEPRNPEPNPTIAN